MLACSLRLTRARGSLPACMPQVSLYDVMPSMCVADLAKAVEAYARK